MLLPLLNVWYEYVLMLDSLHIHILYRFPLFPLLLLHLMYVPVFLLQHRNSCISSNDTLHLLYILFHTHVPLLRFPPLLMLFLSVHLYPQTVLHKSTCNTPYFHFLYRLLLFLPPWLNVLREHAHYLLEQPQNLCLPNHTNLHLLPNF